MSRNNSTNNQEIQPSGSPQSGEPVYLTIGKLRRSHGLKGEILMDVLTDFPERIKSGINVFIGNEKVEYTFASVRSAGNKLLVSLKGFDDCDKVARFRNQLVFKKLESEKILPNGKYYHHEIIGMQVVDESGSELGTITEILVTGANDVYVTKTKSGQEILIPAIKSVVFSIDLNMKKMTVRLQEWA